MVVASSLRFYQIAVYVNRKFSDSNRLDSYMFLCFYVFMRTTIDLPNLLFRRVKAAASLKGLTLKRFITQAIEHEIETQQLQFESHSVSLPMVHSKNPGSFKLDADTIAGLLETDDFYVSS